MQPTRSLSRIWTRAPTGQVSVDGVAAGTYLHRLLEQPEPRHALVRALAAARGYGWQPDPVPPRDSYDALADVLESMLQLDSRYLPILATLQNPGLPA